MEKSSTTSRRSFIKTSGAALAAGAMGVQILSAKTPRYKHNADTLKVGLIGCGGRGTGAANQAMNADPNVALTAMGDVFPDRLEKSYQALKNENPEKLKVEEGNKFIGFDAFQKVIDSGVDVVILTTPPAFRPGHLEYAIAQGKHVFCEKPMAVDAQGVRRIMEAAKKAKEKDLSLVSGFCWRYDIPKRETFGNVLDGKIGEISAIYNTYNTGELWSRPRKEDWTEMEFKMRNWLYYNWLSGDHIAEQAIHSIDMMSWAMGNEMPVKVTGTGGRQVRTDAIFGNVYDHFAIVYEYANGAKGFHFSRQQKGCSRAYHVEMFGNKGTALVDCIRRKHEISGKKDWKYEQKGESRNMYQVEHDELFASIRAGKPMNDGEWMAQSTLLALWGRMAAYTGQTIAFDEAINSQEVLGPQLDQYAWNLDWASAPVALPGKTEFK